MAGIEELHLVGGNPALDFANSVNAHASSNPRDNLHTYDDLLVWSERAGVLTRQQKHMLTEAAAADPQGAGTALKNAVQLREVIFQLFRSVARGGHQEDPRTEPALIAFNSSVERFLRRVRLVRRDHSFELDFDPQGRLDGMLAVIAWSAVELLRSEEIGRVKVCGKDTCGWLFVDRSKNHSRRWCEMSDCGNTVKARRFYERKTGRARGQKD
jgi:predicted RNA-binding Zn ribbon-like protein